MLSLNRFKDKEVVIEFHSYSKFNEGTLHKEEGSGNWYLAYETQGMLRELHFEPDYVVTIREKQ